jgi:fumarate reductase subunit C
MNGLATQVRLWYWQRISAMVMAVSVLVHLGIIIYAVRGGLSAAEILGRTHGSWGFGLFYAVFVIAAAVHVPIGLARIMQEALPGRAKAAWPLAGLFGVWLLVSGLRAVYGVVLA